MQNFIQPGDHLDYTATAALTSGSAVLIGTRLGVAVTTLAVGQTGAVRVRGVFELPKLTSDNVAQGAALYWDNTNKRLTTTASGNTYAGYAAAAAGNTSPTVRVHLNG